MLELPLEYQSLPGTYKQTSDSIATEVTHLEIYITNREGILTVTALVTNCSALPPCRIEPLLSLASDLTVRN